MKKIAVDIVRDYTGSEDGLESLGKYSNVVLPSLSRLLGEKKVPVSSKMCDYTNKVHVMDAFLLKQINPFLQSYK